jgi:prepilin-type N-terminal cleavage/methylation domain-containing protein
MIFMGHAKVLVNKGFTLVELLLVIVLIAIIMALVTLSGGNIIESTSAQTEARRLVRTVQSLRSSWFACYADTQVMLGVRGPAADGVTLTGNLAADLGTYSDRSLADEMARYGNISVDVTPGGKISVGFLGPWKLGDSVNAAQKAMMTILNTQAGDYDLRVAEVGGDAESVFIRVR